MLVSVALSAVLVSRHVRQIRAGLTDRTRTITQFMVRDAIVGVLSDDHVVLRHLASLAAMQQDVRYAAIHDADGAEMARRGEAPPASATLGPPRWEFRAPLYASGTQIGSIRLGISHATLDHERNVAVLTAIAFTTLVTTFAIVGAVVFMRRHLATFLAGAALAEERERVADLKVRILTQTSHEFRTPLAVILSATDVLQRYGERLTADERSGRIEKVRSAVRQMTDLLDDVLMFGRTDASCFAPVPIDLVELCRAAVEQARPLVTGTLQLRAVLPPAPLEASVDPFLLGQMLRNVLTNAIRFSPDGGTISVRLDADDATVTVVVADEGIGIPAADLPRLFEPFQRGSNVGKIPGAGLGLAIAKRAIEVHGGRIDVQSPNGGGATFTMTLPAAAAAANDRSAAA